MSEEAGVGGAEEVLSRHVHDALEALHVQAAVQEGPKDERQYFTYFFKGRLTTLTN